MQLIGIRGENFKKLKLVDVKFDPKSNSVFITGDNRSGKTSFLDMFEAAFGGAKALKDTPLPIRRGEDHAKVVAETDEITVTRTWTSAGNTYVTVTNKDGWTPSGGVQALLDKMYSAFSFDPLAFSLMDEKKQRETLLKHIDIGMDLNAWAQDRKTRYDARTKVNGEITDLEGQLKLMAEVPADIPDEEVSTATVLEEQQKAQEVIDHNRERARRLEDAEQDLLVVHTEVIALQNEIDRLTEKLHDKLGIECEAAAYRDKVRRDIVDRPVKDPDMTVFPAKLEKLEDTNRKVRIKKKRAEIVTALAAKHESAKALTDYIATLDRDRENAIKKAKMPVDGLSFDENGLIFNGIPAVQWSDEEMLTISTAMGMALNPKLKAMFIREASLMSERSRERLIKLAAEKGYTVFMEIVDTSGKYGIYLEDGEVKSIDGKAIEQPKAEKKAAAKKEGVKNG